MVSHHDYPLVFNLFKIHITKKFMQFIKGQPITSTFFKVNLLLISLHKSKGYMIFLRSCKCMYPQFKLTFSQNKIFLLENIYVNRRHSLHKSDQNMVLKVLGHISRTLKCMIFIALGNKMSNQKITFILKITQGSFMCMHSKLLLTTGWKMGNVYYNLHLCHKRINPVA